MTYYSRMLGMGAAFGLLVAVSCLPANAQTAGGLGDGLGGALGDIGDAVGGIVDGIGGALGGGTGSGVSVGDTSIGGTGAAAAVDGTENGLGGNVTGAAIDSIVNATLGLTSTDQQTTGALSIGIVNGLVENTPLGDATANLDIGLPGIAGVQAGLNNGTLSLGLGLGLGLVADDPTTPTTPTGPISGVVSSLSANQLAKFAIRCRQILASPSAFDADLIALCRAIKTARR